MSAGGAIDVLRSCPDGRYQDQRVVVTARPGAGLRAGRGPDGRIRVRHGWRAGELDDEIAGPLATALRPLTEDHDTFGRAFTGIVLTTAPDAVTFASKSLLAAAWSCAWSWSCPCRRPSSPVLRFP